MSEHRICYAHLCLTFGFAHVSKVKSAPKIISTWEWASISLLFFSQVRVSPTDHEVGWRSFPGNLSSYVLLMLWILLYISFLVTVFLAILCAAAIVGVAFYTLSCRAKLYKHCDCRISWWEHGAVKQTMALWNYLPWLIHVMELQSSSFTCSVSAFFSAFLFSFVFVWNQSCWEPHEL